MTSLIYRQPGIIKQINQPSKQQQHPSNKSTSSINLSYSNMLVFPSSLPNIKFSFLKQLILNNNKLSQFQFDTQTFPLLTNLSIQYNQLSKFKIRRSITTQNLVSNLQIINLSHNCMEFIDLSLCIKLNNLNLGYNKLSTVILNQTNLQQLDISHNMLSNIQYSVLGGRIFHKLKYLYINNNKRSLYDLILSINNIQLLPNLKQLDCSNNILSYLQNLPVKLQKLNLQENNFIFDRKSVNQIIKLTNLQELRICGNMIREDYLNIMESKMRNKGLKIYYKKTASNIKESPYRIYEDGINLHDEQNEINHSNFTLGNQNQNIDPDYNLIQQTPRLFAKNQTQTQQKQQQKQQQQQIQQSNDRTALKKAQNILKPQKYKLKIQGLRYQNHYKNYFQKLAQFMLISPRPLLHAQRSVNVSERIDPTDGQQFVNQFQLLNQMFKARGGLHYVRKIYNWQHTQKMKAQDIQIAFINMEMNQKTFNKICDDDISQFQKAIKSRHFISQQPSSFSCYHILARLSMREPKWSCFYLVQAVHL